MKILQKINNIFCNCRVMKKYQNSPEMNVSAQALSNACLNFANGQFSTKLQSFEVSKFSEISSKFLVWHILMKFPKIY